MREFIGSLRGGIIITSPVISDTEIRRQKEQAVLIYINAYADRASLAEVECLVNEELKIKVTLVSKTLSINKILGLAEEVHRILNN